MLSICASCRASLVKPRPWLLLLPDLQLTRRHRSGGGSRPKQRSRTLSPTGPSQNEGKKTQNELLSLSPSEPQAIIRFFEDRVKKWSRNHELQSRLVSFGVPGKAVLPLLSAFATHAVGGKFRNNAEVFANYGFLRLANFELGGHPADQFTDIIFTSILYSWATDPANYTHLCGLVGKDTVDGMRRLSKACDRRYPADEYPLARRMRRKIIMHVGPTNSGKTYHALRALAAAGSGVYAGPLRLLAHEIWERLNLGLIVPAGVEKEDRTEAIIKNDALLRNPKYSRLCNMVTGEEQKIVSEDAPLVSCTVEMAPLNKKVDVAVIDEIQLIGDESRGYAWTSAVLGMCAKELHLCGEETAVPIVEELAQSTGDQVEVRRYQRLTPLIPEDTPVSDSLTEIRKGDCIVAFSRARIFALKHRIEGATGLRCAVVYGRLPPEVRSKQAELFNDPNNTYDVIIGSDAIGMGLNLKIRRIIFDDVKKFHNGVEHILSPSQVKQIAGRAGRFGLHTDDTAGYTTAFSASALKHVTKSLQSPYTPLRTARLSPTSTTYHEISKALPKRSTLQVMFNAHVYVSTIQPLFQYMRMAELDMMCAVLDSLSGVFTFRESVFLFLSPIPWREDQSCVKFIVKLISAFQGDYAVHVHACLKDTGLLDNLERVEELMDRGDGQKRPSAEMIQSLESLHKLLGLYAWLSYRRPVAFSSVAEVYDLKPRVEKALHWSLNAASKLPPNKDIPLADGTETDADRVVEYRLPHMHLNHIQVAQQVQNGQTQVPRHLQAVLAQQAANHIS